MALAMMPIATLSAANYNYMVFEDLSGQVKVISALGLTMSIADGKLTATTGTETVEMPVATLSGIYFAQTSGSSTIDADRLDEEATVYTLQGTIAGRYSTAREAISSLKSGIYLISTKSQTFKIAVK